MILALVLVVRFWSQFILCVYIYAQLSLSVACFCRELGYPKFARFALMSDWLVVWNILNFIFFHILGIIIPTD